MRDRERGLHRGRPRPRPYPLPDTRSLGRAWPSDPSVPPGRNVGGRGGRAGPRPRRSARGRTEAGGRVAVVYLDANATEPLRPEAREAMLAALATTGNPSSVHASGRAARKLLEDARELLA